MSTFVELAEQGWHFAELATGHFPMFSAPDQLAELPHGVERR